MTARGDAVLVGDCWHDEKAWVLQDLVREAGRTGSKRSIPRIAAKAGVEESALRGLLKAAGPDEDRQGWEDRDDETVLAVLDALGVSVDEFTSAVDEQVDKVERVLDEAVRARDEGRAAIVVEPQQA